MKLKIKKYMAFLIATVFILTSVSSVASARFGVLGRESKYEDKGKIISENTARISSHLIKGEKGVTFFGRHFDTYLPINLPKEYKRPGLEVEFSFEVAISGILSLTGLTKFVRGILPIKIEDIKLVKPETDTNLVFDISMENLQAVSAESKPLKATLTNEGEREISVSEMALEVRTLNFEIRTPKGDVLEYIGPIVRRSPDVVVLNPGESMEVKIDDITDEGLFGIPDEDSYDFVPGDYAVHGFYMSGSYNPSIEVERIFEGTLESNVEHFKIVEDSVGTKILTVEADPISITHDVFYLEPEPIEYLATLDGRIHAVYEKDAEVEIRALKEHNKYTFESWQKDVSGDENIVTIVLDRDKTVVGKYAEENVEDDEKYSLTIDAYGCGTTSPNPGVYEHSAGEEVIIKAELPKMDGCIFVQWKGDDIEGSKKIEEKLVMNSDKRVTAIFECIPVASFTYGPIIPLAGEEILFTSTSLQTCSEIVTYKWDFGDGVTEVLDKPEIKHTYTQGGVYSVKLTVIDDSGNFDSIIEEVTVEGTGQSPSDNEEGIIQGTVIERGRLDKPISGASVLVIPDDAHSVDDNYKTLTGESGFYSIKVPAGGYTVIVSKKGYVSAEKVTVVTPEEISVVDFVLVLLK